MIGELLSERFEVRMCLSELGQLMLVMRLATDGSVYFVEIL